MQSPWVAYRSVPLDQRICGDTNPALKSAMAKITQVYVKRMAHRLFESLLDIEREINRCLIRWRKSQDRFQKLGERIVYGATGVS